MNGMNENMNVPPMPPHPPGFVPENNVVCVRSIAHPNVIGIIVGQGNNNNTTRLRWKQRGTIVEDDVPNDLFEVMGHCVQGVELGRAPLARQGAIEPWRGGRRTNKSRKSRHRRRRTNKSRKHR